MAERSDSARVHGGIDPAELARYGLDAKSVFDLSVNVNPRGPHPAVVAAIAAASIADYPDRHATAARHAIARAIDSEPDGLALGHGSVELLWAIVGLMRRETRGELLIVGPTFGEIEAAARAHDVPYAHLRMREGHAFSVDAACIDAALRERASGAVYLCQPNNPTGRALGDSELQALIAAHAGTLFILDQAFLSLSTQHAQIRMRLERHANVIAVRSLTKDHALAGLRVGYAVASPQLVARVEAQRPPWMVSEPAQAAVVAAMEQHEYVREAREYLLAARVQLSAALTALGFTVIPSETHYCLVKVGDADALRDRLLRRERVLVRSCTSFGLPAFIRVAAGIPAASERLLRGLAEYRSELPRAAVVP